MSVIGIDFDNTIIRYEPVFEEIVKERGYPISPVTKTALRDYLRAIGEEPVWTEIQGLVYGPRIEGAAVAQGFLDKLRTFKSAVIISHKTKLSYSKDGYNLHDSAKRWLDIHGITNKVKDIFFEETKEAKLNRIRSENCSVFIDDLPEILTDPLFPKSVRAVLYDPYNESSYSDRFSNWSDFK